MSTVGRPKKIKPNSIGEKKYVHEDQLPGQKNLRKRSVGISSALSGLWRKCFRGTKKMVGRLETKKKEWVIKCEISAMKRNRKKNGTSAYGWLETNDKRMGDRMWSLCHRMPQRKTGLSQNGSTAMEKKSHCRIGSRIEQNVELGSSAKKSTFARNCDGKFVMRCASNFAENNVPVARFEVF